MNSYFKKLRNNGQRRYYRSTLDHEKTFELAIVSKRRWNVSNIQDKVPSMYAKRMSQRDIADAIEDIYGFEISYKPISEITDRVLN